MKNKPINSGRIFLDPPIPNRVDQRSIVLSGGLGVCGTSAIGAYFSPDSCLYNSSIGIPINVIPQAVNDSNNIVTDTLNWILVSSIIQTAGGESFMTIGNFWGPSYNATNSDTICGSGNGGLPYFFIDDISVVKLPKINTGADQSITAGDTITLNASLSETWSGMQFEWLPYTGLDDPYNLTVTAHPDSTVTYVLTVSCPTCDVPCLTEVVDSITIFVSGVEPPQTFPFHVPTLLTTGQIFVIDSLQPNTRLKIYDVRGRLVYSSENYNNDFSCSNLSTAIYNYEIELVDSRKFAGKFAVVEP